MRIETSMEQNYAEYWQYHSMMILQYGQSISIPIIIYPDPVMMKTEYYFIADGVIKACYPYYTYVSHYATKSSIKPKICILQQFNLVTQLQSRPGNRVVSCTFTFRVLEGETHIRPVSDSCT